MLVKVATEQLDAFMRGYLECAVWTMSGEDAGDLGVPSVEDIAEESVARARETCDDFLSANYVDLNLYTNNGYGWDVAGSDFWLTRNGHGAGFWDRGLGDLGLRLSAASRVYSSCDLYVGDDHKIHFR